MAAAQLTRKDFSVMDCDGHILEPQEIWTDYVEPEFRAAVRAGLWKQDYPEGGWRIDLNGTVHRDKRGPIAFFGAIMRPGIDRDALSTITMNSPGYPIAEGAYDPRIRLAHMDLMGIDQVMLLPTFCGMTYTCIGDPRAALGLARAYNNWIADFCRPDPSRLFAAGIVPQHDNDDAVSEIHRIADMGLRCVIIRPNVIAGRYPAHPNFDPIWQAIEDRGLVAGVHPFVATPNHEPDCTAWFLDRASEASGLRTGIMSETICFAHDAQAFLLLAFHNDLFTRFPTLKLAILESNASWLPYLLDKADGRVQVWTATRGTPVIARPSKTFYERCWIGFESDEDTVFEAWRRYEDIGVWASDYPHFDAEDAWEGIEHMERWSVPMAVQAKLLGANACRMYGIEQKLVVTERLPVDEAAVSGVTTA
jgi:predicted TIM-barrel fold metal-dependent hydrolase